MSPMLSALKRALTALLITAAGAFGLSAQQSDAPRKPAKFALLIGVDDYAQPSDSAYAISPLKGPGNDVALIRALLTTRYGFANDAEHIVALVGKSATRAAITEQFRTHLIENAKKEPAGTFVFYFSGHGSQTPDLDGDEGDGDDETLVAYDSRADGGRDIVDDEVGRWLEQLAQYTKNITLIFDSCHSGSATRGTAVAKRLPPAVSRPTVPPRSSRAVPAPRSDAAAKDGMVGRDKRWSIIAGSPPEDLSYEDEVQTPDGKKYHGLLTYNLVNTLERNPDLTYEQAVRDLEAGLRRQAPSQRPQVEGDVDRVVFAGSDRRSDPYIAVTEVTGMTLNVAAGAAHGLREGGIVAVYSAHADRLVGERDKLANARLTSVGGTTSIAMLLETPRGPVTTDARVKLVTSYPAAERLAVAIPSGSQLSALLKQRLDKSVLARPAGNAREAFASVESECAGQGRRKNSGAAGPCELTYFLALSDRRAPLFDLRVAGAKPGEAADRLFAAIESLAKQESVRVLENAASPYRGKLKISLIRVDVETQGGSARVKGERLIDRTGMEAIRVGEHFRFKVENTSDQDFYVAVVWLGTSGRIGLYTPSGTGERLNAGNSMTTKPTLQAGPPLGLETYKVIATTDPRVNFRALEEPGVSKSLEASPLSWLLNQSVNGRFRDPAAAAGLDLDSWTTARIDLRIEQTKQ